MEATAQGGLRSIMDCWRRSKYIMRLNLIGLKSRTALHLVYGGVRKISDADRTFNANMHTMCQYDILPVLIFPRGWPSTTSFRPAPTKHTYRVALRLLFIIVPQILSQDDKTRLLVKRH